MPWVSWSQRARAWLLVCPWGLPQGVGHAAGWRPVRQRRLNPQKATPHCRAKPCYAVKRPMKLLRRVSQSGAGVCLTAGGSSTRRKGQEQARPCPRCPSLPRPGSAPRSPLCLRAWHSANPHPEGCLVTAAEWDLFIGHSAPVKPGL